MRHCLDAESISEDAHGQAREVVALTSTPDADPGRSLTVKVITLLELIAESEHGISVRQVARDTGFDRSAVSRVLTQLRDMGVVTVDNDSGAYCVGARLTSLGEALHARNRMWTVAEPILRDVVMRVDETCYLIARQGDLVVFGERIDCHRPIRYLIEPGTTSPLHVGAAGRAVLLGMSNSEVAAYMDRVDFTPFTRTTVSGREELADQLHKDRLRGFTVSDGERVEGGRGIAAPVFGADGGCMGAVLLSWPSSRFRVDLIEENGSIAIAAAGDISRKLGFSSDRRGLPRDALPLRAPSGSPSL